MGKQIFDPWPWYVVGPLVGLIPPLLLILGNKKFGVSSALRQICAACFPANIEFLKYNWKEEIWNLYFVAGVLIGGFVASHLLSGPGQVAYLPANIFNWHNLVRPQGLCFMVAGGFLVGFGTRYAGGCTSGHGIMGTATLQWTSFVALTCFFAGGLFSTHYIVPLLLKL